MKSRQALKLLSLVIFLVITSPVVGQAPEKINYQAIARNTETGVELIRQEIFVIAKIRQNGPNGSIVYQEEHSVETNSFGLFGLAIGGGQANEGNFGSINWGNGIYWLEIDVDAGNGLETMGGMQFMSVPYALHAGTVSDKDDADADPENEKITDFSLSENGSTISLTEAGTIRTIDIPQQNDGDSNPENELISAISLDANGVLNISEGGVTHSTDFSLLNTDDADADPENELISSFEYNPVTAILSLSEGNNAWTHDLSGLAGNGTPDGDSDPNNEHVIGFGIDSGNLRLTQSGTGQTFNVPLSDLASNDADADPINEIQNLALSGDVLSITGNSNPLLIDLAQYRNDADADPNNEHVTGFGIVGSNLRLSQSGSGQTFNLPLSSFASNDADADPTNEKIINWTPTASGYTFTEAGTNYTINKNDADANATNELVTSFGINGANLRLQQAGSGLTFNVPLTALADADADPTNEKIINWTPTASGYTFTEAGTNYNINKNDADADATNELVTSFGINGANLRLQQAGSGPTFNVPLTALALDDADADPTNELVTSFGINGANLRLQQAGSGATFNVPLSALAIDDADADPNNEKQTLAQVLAYTGPMGLDDGRNAGGNKIINLGTPTAASDAATKQYADGLVHAGDVSGIYNATVVRKIQGIPVQNIVPTDGMILKYNGSLGRWEPSTATVAVATPTIKYYNVGPSDFVCLQQNGDFGKLNMVIPETDPSFVTINKKNDGQYLTAPFHLPHGSLVNEIKIYYKIKESNNMNLRIDLQKTEIATGIILPWLDASYTTNFDNNNLVVDIIDLTVDAPASRTIDNDKYFYHIKAWFDSSSNFDNVADADIQLHTVVFQYTE